jgi:hypothetical protein
VYRFDWSFFTCGLTIENFNVKQAAFKTVSKAGALIKIAKIERYY